MNHDIIVLLNDMHLCMNSQVGVFQFITQLTNLVNEKTRSFQQWYNDVVLQVDHDINSEQLTELIKSSFNTVLIASQYIIKQYNMLQSHIAEYGMYL